MPRLAHSLVVGVSCCFVLLCSYDASAASISTVVVLDGAERKDMDMQSSILSGPGYPKDRVLKGAAGEKLHPDVPPREPVPYAADDETYPGGGKMSAEDIHELVSEISPAITQARAAKKADMEYQDQNSKLMVEQMKDLAAGLRGGVQGEELLSGAIPQQLAIVKGNLGNCLKKVLMCKFDKSGRERTLGEAQSPEQMDTTSPKHTAIEEDRINRLEPDPAAYIKAKPPTQSETQTGTEDYVDSQRGAFWSQMPHQPGFKLKHDRMSSNDIAKLVGSSTKMINDAKAMSAKEAAADMKQVKDSGRQALSALNAVARSASQIAASRAAPKTAAVLHELATTNDKLLKCMNQVHDNCKDGTSFPAAQPAAKIGTVVGEGALKFPDPGDDPDRQDPDDSDSVGKPGKDDNSYGHS